MAMWGSQINPQQLQQAIDCLHRLNKVPGPATKDFTVSVNDSTQYSLPLSREIEIASNLAFLSATTDNSLRVMAVCVEERSSGSGMTIRVASNTGDLIEITKEFRKLAGILEQAARRG